MEKKKNSVVQHRVCALSFMSDSLRLLGLQPIRFLCPWDFPGKNMGVGFHSLLQGIFLTQGWNQFSLVSPAVAAGFFTTALPGKPHNKVTVANNTVSCPSKLVQGVELMLRVLITKKGKRRVKKHTRKF